MSEAARQSPIRVTVVQPGLAKYRVPVFQELASRPGIELRVVYGTRPDIPNVEPVGFVGVPSLRWERRIWNSPVMAQGAEWKYSSPRHSDVVVLRWSPRSLTLLPALLRARSNGVGTVLWGHGYSKSDRSSWRAARNVMAKLASSVLFYEPRTRGAFIRDGWDQRKLFVALNCLGHTEIDAARRWWLDRPDELDRFRRERNLDSGPVILFVSRLNQANRVDWLVQATAELAREIPTLKTVIIGNGVDERERLQALARTVGAADNVVFQDGIYDESALAPWFLSADVFCYPLNIGLSIIHAFWYGLPVVTSDRLDMHNPEIVALSHGVNGLTYEHGNVRSLANVLRQLIANQSLCEAMSVSARRTVEDSFTIANMVDGLEAAIRYAFECRHASGRDGTDISESARK